MYLFLMSGRQRAEDVVEAFDAGADEFVSKPFDLQILMARVQAAIRRHPEGKQGDQRLTSLLSRLHEGMTGEIVVRSQSQAGRIVLHRGKIAWIHLPGGSPLLPLLGQIGVAESDARMVLEECQKNRLPFMDTLVHWNLAPRDLLKHHIQLELARRLNALIELTDASSFFVPGEAAFQSGFAYDLPELAPSFDAPLSRPAPSSTGPSSRPIPEVWARVAREARGLPGVECVALIDPPTGAAMYQDGKPFDRDLVIGLLRVLRAAHDEKIEKTLLVGKPHVHILQSLSEHWLLYLKADQDRIINLALLQFRLQEIVLAASPP